jgi:hypothetical protein
MPGCSSGALPAFRGRTSLEPLSWTKAQWSIRKLASQELEERSARVIAGRNTVHAQLWFNVQDCSAWGDHRAIMQTLTGSVIQRS